MFIEVHKSVAIQILNKENQILDRVRYDATNKFKPSL